MHICAISLSAQTVQCNRHTVLFTFARQYRTNVAKTRTKERKTPSFRITFKNYCNQLHQIRVKWIIIIRRRRLSRCLSVFALLTVYCVRCRCEWKKIMKKNNVAVRPRYSRRRKYITYANSYVALCTIADRLLTWLCNMKTHMHIVRDVFNALWNVFRLCCWIYLNLYCDFVGHRCCAHCTGWIDSEREIRRRAIDAMHAHCAHFGEERYRDGENGNVPTDKRVNSVANYYTGPEIWTML